MQELTKTDAQGKTMNDKELLEAAAELLGKEGTRRVGPQGPYLEIFSEEDGRFYFGLWKPFSDSSIAVEIICKISADLMVNQRTVAIHINDKLKVIQGIEDGDKPRAVRLCAMKAAAAYLEC